MILPSVLGLPTPEIPLIFKAVAVPAFSRSFVYDGVIAFRARTGIS